MVRRIAFLAAFVSLLGVTAHPAVASSEPLRLTFDKSTTATPGVWEGTVSGDVEGDLTTVLLDLETTGSVWHVEFDWIVDAGPSSFTARLDGTLNLRTGSVVMNGTVVDGDLVGAQVHEAGQLVDVSTSRFVGSITVSPATQG